MMNSPFALIPALIFFLWIGVIVYAVMLATRLVNAVEQIARVLTERPPDGLR